MKKASKLMWILLASLLSAVLVVGCAGSPGTSGGARSAGNTPEGLGVLADWRIIPGWENNVAADRLKIEPAREGTNGVARVTWSSSTEWRMCELYALLPEGFDYGVYDGITFKIKLPASSNFLLLLRNPAGGTTWKVWEEYVYRGSDGNELVWVTVSQPFEDAVDSGWGPPPAQATLKGWLTADKDVQKQINLNPMLNTGGGSAENVDLVTYFDDIGFYKGSNPDNPDSFCIIWNFD
jgi:hypothetical protein